LLWPAFYQAFGASLALKSIIHPLFHEKIYHA